MQWYDGSLLADGQSVVDRSLDAAALRFGASVFTTMRIYEQGLEDSRSQFPAHCDRLIRSINTFSWSHPNWSSVYKGCQQLASQYPVLRITLFPNGAEWVTGRALPPQLHAQQHTGITGWLAPSTYARSLPTHKTGNYLACWLARQQAQKRGAQEAILTNSQGDWLETATGNLWGWADGHWWTPMEDTSANKLGRQSRNLCLPGLMRGRVQRILREQGYEINGRRWCRSVVGRFDAIAYTNCVVELMPIHTILSGRTTLEYNAHHASLKALRQWLTSSA